MTALLTAIVIWLSANFDLPAIHDHPRVELVPAVRMAALRYRGLATDRQPPRATANTDAPLASGEDVLAVYDDTKRILYLPEGWTGTTPAELSVLVHEMVHHLQNVAGLKFDCPQAREKPAYSAQDKWLGLFGKNFSKEFEIDAMTILVRTNCMF